MLSLALVMCAFAFAFAYARGVVQRTRDEAASIVGMLVVLGVLGAIGAAVRGASRLPRSDPKWPAIMCIANVPLLMLFFGVLYALKQMG